MLEYKPKSSQDNYNVQSSNIREFQFFSFLIKFVPIIICFYFVSGFILDILINYISPTQEKKLWKDYYLNYAVNSKSLDDKSTKAIILQKLVDKLESNLPIEEQELKLKVYVYNSNELNAFAVPGGYIVVLNGLLKKVESENELAYVLAHEIGHFAHRDQLRGFGQMFVSFLVSKFFFGADNPINKIGASSLVLTEKRFSQSQETAADLFALELLNKTYHHLGGCTDFMQRLGKEVGKESPQDFFATHPHPNKRVEILNRIIHEKNYFIGQKSPLPKGFNIQ